MAFRPWILVAICGCVAGCQISPEQALIGAWSTNRKLTTIPEMPELRSRIQNGVYATQLKLSSDHTFFLTGLRQMGGKWSYADGELILTPSKDSQTNQWRVMSQIRKLKVNEDFSRLTATIPWPLGAIVIVLDKTA